MKQAPCKRTFSVWNNFICYSCHKVINNRTYHIVRTLSLIWAFLHIFMKPIWILYTLYRASNNGEDQTAWMCSMVCAFVVRTQLSQIFSQHAPPVMSKCIYCYKWVSDKKKWNLKNNVCLYTWYTCVVMSVHVVLVMLDLPWLIALALY